MPHYGHIGILLIFLFQFPSVSYSTDKGDQIGECMRSGNLRPNPVICKKVLNIQTRIPPPKPTPEPTPNPVPLDPFAGGGLGGTPIEPEPNTPSGSELNRDNRSFCEKNQSGCISYIAAGAVLATISLAYLGYWYYWSGDGFRMHLDIDADQDEFRSVRITAKMRF